MTIFTNVTIVSTDVTYMRTIGNTSWANAAMSPADLTTTNGGLNTQTFSEDPDSASPNVSIDEAAFSFDTTSLLATYGGAMEITSAKFKFEIVSGVIGSWGIVGYYNHFNPLNVNDWIDPPPTTEPTAFSNILSSVGIQEGILASPDTNIQKSARTGMICVPGGISNSIPPGSSKTGDIATSAHVSGFAPSLIMTIDDHKPPGSAAPMVMQAF